MGEAYEAGSRSIPNLIALAGLALGGVFGMLGTLVALLLISIPGEFALWARLAGVIAAILFTIVVARIFWGEQLLPAASPLPCFAYPFLVIAVVGRVWKLLHAW